MGLGERFVSKQDEMDEKFEAEGYEIAFTGGGASAFTKLIGKNVLLVVVNINDPSRPENLENEITLALWDADFEESYECIWSEKFDRVDEIESSAIYKIKTETNIKLEEV